MRTPDRRWPLSAVPALLFALITWQVMADGPLVRVDERLSRARVPPDPFSWERADRGDVRGAGPVRARVIVLVI
ncbi:hypothetical protein ACFW2E_22140, partial [Streptomyces sp. NPDC058964]